jgi:hypothetical protein
MFHLYEMVDPPAAAPKPELAAQPAVS